MQKGKAKLGTKTKSKRKNKRRIYRMNAAERAILRQVMQ